MSKRVTMQGRVEAVNERGFKVDGKWLNYSKFATDLLRLSDAHVGSLVEFVLDGAGFVRSVSVLSGAGAAQEAARSDASTGAPGSGAGKLALLGYALEVYKLVKEHAGEGDEADAVDAVLTDLLTIVKVLEEYVS